MAFKKGQSGNPSGRPKIVKTIQELARLHCPEAIEALVAVLRNGPPPAKVAAANALLDRGYGKPLQTHSGESTVTHIHTIKEEIIYPDVRRDWDAAQQDGGSIRTTH